MIFSRVLPGQVPLVDHAVGVVDPVARDGAGHHDRSCDGLLVLTKEVGAHPPALALGPRVPVDDLDLSDAELPALGADHVLAVALGDFAPGGEPGVHALRGLDDGDLAYGDGHQPSPSSTSSCSSSESPV